MSHVNISMESLRQKAQQTIAHIQQALGCSRTEAEERLQHFLIGLLFRPDDKPVKPKRVRKTTFNRADYPPEMIRARYYQIDGRVYLRVAANGRPTGTEIGYEPRNGCPAVVYLDGRRAQRSPVVFCLAHGRWPRHAIFHRNFYRQGESPGD